MDETLTIVIPFWNGHATLPRLLKSLPPEIPVIIINDYGSKAPRVDRANTQIVNLNARGYFSGACNAGFKACATDVLILNQDIWFNGIAWLAGVREAQAQKNLATYGHGVLAHPAWPNGYVQGTFMYVSRTAYEKVGGFDKALYPLWGATCEWQLRACRAGFSAYVLAEIPGMQHAKRRRYGSAIERALKQEPTKRGQFIRTPPEVSVIVPEYNYGHFLSECLESILAQTFQSFEIVVVDDASTDGSAEVAAAFHDPWKGVRVLKHGHNRGTAATLNAGIRASFGKYIYIVSADDLLEPWALEQLYQEAIRAGRNFVYGDLLWQENGGRRTFKLSHYDFDKLLQRNHVPACIMYPRIAWKEAQGYPEQFNDGREDWAFAVALGRAGWCGKHVGQTGYIVRRHKHNRSKRNSDQREYFLGKLKETYPDVYQGVYPMACCGRRGKKKATVEKNKGVVAQAVESGPGQDWRLLEYLGKNVGRETYWTPDGRRYKFGRSQRYIKNWIPPDAAKVLKRDYPGIFRDITPIVPKETESLVKEPEIPELVGEELPEIDTVFTAEPQPPTVQYDEQESELFTANVVVNATQSALLLATEHEIDLSTIEGTGKDGKILVKDVRKLL